MRYINILKGEFKGYSAKKLSSDILAGITVAAVALPLSLAFAVSNGVDASAGLVTAIIAGLVATTLSGAYYQISGPTGTMVAVMMILLSKYSMQGVFMATLLAGVFLLIAGIFKLGKLTSFIPMPVITGFTSGIAIIIAMGQIDNFFGVSSSGSTQIQKLLSYCTNGFHINLTTFGIALFVVLFMAFFPSKWNAVVPSSLIAIIITTATSIIFKFDVTLVGNIPQTLLPETRLTFSMIDFSLIPSLLSPALTIALLVMIETLLCGASAGRMTGVRLDNDQELMAQGIGNIVMPFFGGIPATAALARTSVSIKSGAKTRVSGIVHSLTLLIFMLVLAPIMSKIPLAALAGVLMVTAFRMNDWQSIKYFFTGKFKSSIAMYIATVIATVVFDLTVAIAVGVCIAIVVLLAKLSKLDVAIEKVDLSRIDIDDKEVIHHYKNSLVAYISGPMMFAACQQIEDLDGEIGQCDMVFFSMRGVSDMDISGAQSMITLIKKLKDNNIKVAICSLQKQTAAMFERFGLTELVGAENIYSSVDKALLDESPTVVSNI